MKYEEAYSAIQQTVIAIHDKIGQHYRGCYLYGSLAQGFYQSEQSDVNLLVIVEDGTSIHPIRDAFLPIWEKHQHILKIPPGVAQRTDFKRHMELNPLLSQHINRYGRQVQGTSRVLRRTDSLDQRFAVGYLASQALQASNALLPDLILSEEERAEALRLLRCLVRQIRQDTVDPAETPLALFLELQAYLQERIANVDVAVTAAAPPSDPPYDLPGLQSVYEKMDQLVITIEDVEALTGYTWDDLLKKATGYYGGLQIGTPEQLALAVEFETPLEHLLRNYRHQWGIDLLKVLEPPLERSLRDAARYTSKILVFDLPQAYLTAADDADLRKVIHDFQNKLLNTRLQNELLGRLKVVAKGEPDTPLPERTAPLAERIEGIFAHLDWWTDYYIRAMNQVSNNQ